MSERRNFLKAASLLPLIVSESVAAGPRAQEPAAGRVVLQLP
jgi:hypothetical protein